MTTEDTVTPPGTGALAPTSSDSLTHYYEERLESVRRLLPEATRQLKAAGVAHVRVEYDGCGDSGAIERIEFRNSKGASVDIEGKVDLSEDELIDLFYDLTQARHPGWESGNGAFGELDWDLETETLSHTHNDRFTDYDTTEHHGL